MKETTTKLSKIYFFANFEKSSPGFAAQGGK